MPRGGFRPGAGRPVGTKKSDGKPKVKKSKPSNDLPDIPEDIKTEAAALNLSPLDYMLRVMNDPEAHIDRRDKMALNAAPFVHAKPSDKPGKKEEKDERAKKLTAGRFSPTPAPKVININGGKL